VLVLLPDESSDGEIYLTAAEAAAVAGVKPPAVRRWVRIGYLTPAAKDPRGRALYTFAAVTRAEKLARDAAIRTSGTTKRVRRHHEAA
jgi:DNA-binding transcriptional MerR regulator